MQNTWCVIIGAGFAGAATAYHLTRRGAREIILIEQERQPGVHSSGRNAAMIRQVVTDRDVAGMARRGAAGLGGLASEWDEPVPYRRCGSLLLGRDEAWRDLAEAASEGKAAGLDVKCLSPEAAIERVPILEGVRFDGAVWTAGDGVVELGPFLHGYLGGALAAGADVRYDCQVREIRRDEGRLVVVTRAGEISAEVVVNAAGAWAAEVGKTAGASPPPLRPSRRHLCYTGPLPGVDPDWPFVWDVSSKFYFRPETGGLLLSPCDETEQPPGDSATDPEIEYLLAERIASGVPKMPDLPIQKKWAGLRTLTPDGRFVIGWDPSVNGLFWVAGLGGHGVTCSYSVGELAAKSILEGTRSRRGPFDPNRFVTP